jgi:hypothetical protein
MDPNEQFEIINELYHRRFHRLRPGKSESMASGHDSMDDENVAQFKMWLASDLAFQDAIRYIHRLKDRVAQLEGADSC